MNRAASPQPAGGQIVASIFAGAPIASPAFWPGSPTREALARYAPSVPTGSDIDFALALESDAVWLPAELLSWHHPGGEKLWRTRDPDAAAALDSPGVFAECEDVAEVHAFTWPDPDSMDFTSILATMRRAQDAGIAVLGGPWTYITTIVSEFFGMEEFLVKMYTAPEVMDAVIGHVVDFYLGLNERFFALAGDALDVFFFASDMGSQQDPLFGPELFDRFFRDPFSRVVAQAKSYGYPVLLHSCGAISKFIPRLIEIGIDGLHPLQANARGMQAEILGREYSNDLVFVGGVDTQELLPFADAEAVRAEVHRLSDLFGPRFIASPSHEGVLPNVPLENLHAIRRGVQDLRGFR